MLLPLYHCRPTFSSKPILDPNPSLSPCTSSYFSKTCIHFHSLKPPKSLPHHSQLSADKEAVSKTAIQRIAEKLRSLGYLEESEETHQRPETGHGSAGEIFIPSSHVLPKHRVGHTIDASWSTPESPVPEPGSGIAIMRFHEMKGELEKQKVREAGEKKKRAVVPTLAELTIPEEELKRLRGIGIRLEKRLKIGKAGITEGIVNGIHERWRRSEVVKIKCEDLCRMNMKRTHEILERKTGGLVVWRSGSIIILYRGANYEYPYFLPDNNTGDGSHSSSISCPDSSEEEEDAGKQDKNSSGMVGTESSVESIPSRRLTRPSLIAGVGSPEKVRFQLPGEKQLEEEAHHLLDGLGPRFTDWWGYEPLPVDADLLPAIVPGYRKPFRLLPYGVKPKLTDSEMTILRRLGRPLPCHFALGRNRNLQGLAVSIVKLWEKCEIAKIAVKRGVQNTNSEMMAEEIKRLTGGTLLSRDREFIVFYRGKDFLPPAVSAAIEERRNYAIHMDKRSTKNSASVEVTLNRETRPAGPSDLQEVNDQKGVSTMEPRNLKSTGAALRSLDAKFSLALEKKAKAEKLLAELDKAAQLQTPEEDKEGISEEERYMLRKVGLRMKPFLLLGRRGVFDGTVENMHLHWKYRELVKVISKDRCVEDVHRAARTLEAESGGILVAVARVNKGHAIIIYRGKNYKRPGQLRPRTLLNKKEAMKRSLEAQRRESLKLHVLNLTKNLDQMKLRLANDDTVTDSVQPTEYNIVTNGLETGDDVGSLKSSHHQVNAEAKEEADVDGISFHSTECMVSSCESEERATMSSATELKFVEVLDKGRSVADASSPHSIEHVVTSSDSEEIATDHGVTNVNFPENNMQLEASGSWGSAADNNEVKMTSFQSFGKRHDMSVNKSDKKGLSEVEVPSRVPLLSNKDRLILRKQALKMKKRPVLAVGRNNAVSGVAKAIKMHFQRNPLAIVSIKGRAKGTSAQEVVFMLEQATGAVLVSKEPTKVILYRGWGEGEEPGNAGKSLRSKGSREAVSPQLLDAIRLECGLPTTQEEDETHL